MKIDNFIYSNNYDIIFLFNHLLYIDQNILEGSVFDTNFKFIIEK